MAIIYKAKGQVIPKDYLEMAAKEQKCMGLATAIEDVVGVSAESNGQPLNTGEWAALMEQMKDMEAVYYLGYNELPAEDIPPFTILTDKVNEQECSTLVCFAEGDFDGFAKPESTHTSAFFAVNDEIIPQIANLSEMLGGNIPKLMTGLKSSVWEKNFSKLWVRKGSIVLVGSNGAILRFSSEPATEYDWGWTLGFGEYPKKVEEPPKETFVSKAAGFLNKIASSKTAGTVAKTTVEDTPGRNEPPKEQTNGPDIVPTAENNWGHPDDDHEWKVPPHSVRKKSKDLTSWYRQVHINGTVPTDFQDFPPIRSKSKRVPAAAVAAPATDTAAAPQPAPTPSPYKSFSEAGEALKGKDTTAHHIPKPLKDVIKDVSSRKIGDPAGWQKIEDAVPDVAQREGFNFEDTLRWGIDDLKMLAQTQPGFTAELLHNYRTRYMGVLGSKKETKLADGKTVVQGNFLKKTGTGSKLPM